MQRKNILILVKEFPPYCPALGHIIRTTYLADFLVKQGHTVHVICQKRKKTWFSNLVNPKVDVHTFSSFIGRNDLDRKNADFFVRG